MPEYLAPGVYVEETSFRAKAIEGVGTSTAAFVGPTLACPVDPSPAPVTSFAEFEQVFGGLDNLQIGGVETPNYVAHAVRAFFAEGGRRLYVGRVEIPEDGQSLTAEDFVGAGRERKTGLAALEGCDDISIVAAPGAAADGKLGRGVMQALVRHVEQNHYRFAVLDSIRGQSLDDIRALRSQFDTSRAALYYPWVLADDPLAGRRRRRLALPPSGFVCGIYARNDIGRGVHKTSANEVIRSARGLERRINSGQQAILNPQGINCLRTFQGRGHRVWGARTVSSDPEWKYVNVRRYFLYLEQSIDQGTQWVVFEPNGEPLWTKVRQTVEMFLYDQFRSGVLVGNKPEDSYFVKCDRTTMTQNDIDNGRLICLIGVAAVDPAEFIIFRIGQKTADAEC